MSAQIVIFLLIIVAAIVVGRMFFTGNLFFPGRKTEKPSAIKGLYALAESRTSAALDELKRIVLKGGGTPEVYILMSTLYRRQGDPEKAIHFCEGILLGRDQSDEIITATFNELVKAYRAAGHTHKAQECLQNLSKKQASLPIVSLVNAEIAKSKGDFEGAIRSYTKYEKATGEKCGNEITDVYIKIYKKEKDLSRKLKALRNATKCYPEGHVAYFLTAELFLQEGKKDKGMQEIKTIIEKDLIKSKADLQKLEDIFYTHSTLDELFRMMSARIAAETDNPAPYLFAANYYTKKNNAERAREILKAYLLHFPPRAIITKAYTKLANDEVLLRVANYDNLYCCAVCNSEFSDFAETCPKCGNPGTMEYL